MVCNNEFMIGNTIREKSDFVEFITSDNLLEKTGFNGKITYLVDSRRNQLAAKNNVIILISVFDSQSYYLSFNVFRHSLLPTSVFLSIRTCRCDKPFPDVTFCRVGRIN